MTADVQAEVVDNGHLDTPDVTREEVAKAVETSEWQGGRGRLNCGRAFEEWWRDSD